MPVLVQQTHKNTATNINLESYLDNVMNGYLSLKKERLQSA